MKKKYKIKRKRRRRKRWRIEGTRNRRRRKEKNDEVENKKNQKENEKIKEEEKEKEERRKNKKRKTSMKRKRKGRKGKRRRWYKITGDSPGSWLAGSEVHSSLAIGQFLGAPNPGQIDLLFLLHLFVHYLSIYQHFWVIVRLSLCSCFMLMLVFVVNTLFRAVISLHCSSVIWQPEGDG